MTKAALVAVQLEIGPDVLASADAYRRALDDAGARAAERGATADARLVVFPEVAGHLALYALAPPLARRQKTLGAALAVSAVRRPLEVLRGVSLSRTLGARSAVLAALAPDGERWWKGVFGPLARRTRSYVVAGSHLRLHADGSLTNSSLLFDPDGKLLATTDKVNLVPGMEDAGKGGLGLARGDADALPVVSTALGKLATLVCYDGFTRPHTRHERFVPLGSHLRADVIANPAANPWPWRERWPFDDRVRAEQWEQEGMPAMLREAPCARYAVTAHLVGRVLDLHFDGCSEILERAGDGRVERLARAERPDRGDLVSAIVEL
ncbi:MAG: carbon-nitrogen hydrolase family protein [Acidobacteriota bacterium]